MNMTLCNVSSFWKRVLFIVCIVFPAISRGQEKECPFYASANVSSRYIWRGTGNGNAPLIMPVVGFNKGGFDVYVWGAYSLDDSYREVNIGVSYSFSNFTVELVDYFYPGSGSDFFNFSNKSTTHSVEAIATYEPEAVPVHITVGSIIYGDDKKDNGNNAFSTYAEVGYTHQFNSRNAVSAAVGASLNKSFYTNYTKGFQVVNLSAAYTRTFTLWNYQLPVGVMYSFNPYIEKSYWAVSFDFAF